MNFQITSTGNKIVADLPFMESQHPGDYTQLPDDPVAVAPSPPISKREFLKLFTPVEYGAIKTAANVNTTVDYYWQQFLLAEFISLSNVDTLGGLELLESAGLLSAGRAAEIVS